MLRVLLEVLEGKLSCFLRIATAIENLYCLVVLEVVVALLLLC